MSMLVLPFVVVLLILGMIFALSKKRAKDLATAAASIGFCSADDVPIVCEMPIFEHFDEMSNIFIGSAQGFESTFFDLTVGQGRSQISQTVGGFRREGLVIPPFQVHAKTLGDRIAAHFSSEIVQITSDPNFAERYTIRSVNPDGCERFFSPEITSYFVQLPPNEWTVEGAADSLIIYRAGHKCASSNIAHFISETGNIAAGLLGILRPTSVI